jgi:hypothetical protein
MRDPFAFLQSESPERVRLLLLLALVKQQGGEVKLTLQDLTSIDDGAGLFRRTSDKGDELVLCFARKGAEAYFLSEPQPSPPTRATKVVPQSTDATVRSRSTVHNDLDLALLEEQQAERMQELLDRQTRQARREAGAVPWTTRPS